MTSSDEKDKILTMHSDAERQAPALPPELQGQIGKKLREAYTELVTEPVPDRFVMLLQKLKKQESGDQGGAA